MIDPFELVPALFYIAMAIAAVGWLALLFFPRRLSANLWFAGVAVPLVLGLFYLFIMLIFWFQPPQGKLVNFLSIGGMERLFQNRGLLVAAWMDLLLLPLILGAWMARKAMQVRMPYIYLLPCLLLTATVPGIGFVLFVVVASFGSRWGNIAQVENVAPTNSAPVAVTPTGSELP